MAISISQQVDYLWKKLGFGVAKTDASASKDATNESIPSAPFMPGHEVWAESHLVPNIRPNANTSVLEIRDQTTACQCTMDPTAPLYRTWITGRSNWVPVMFGSTYQVKVYLDSATATNPVATGTRLYSTGSGNNDEWFFDYESGVLYFIGDQIPSATWSGKKIYVVGAIYTGAKGLAVLNNVTIAGTNISSNSNGTTIVATGGNLTLGSSSGTIDASGSILANVAYSSAPGSAATTEWVVDTINNMHPNAIWVNDSSVFINDDGINPAAILVTVDGSNIATFNPTDVKFANIQLSGSTISSQNNLVIQSQGENIVQIAGTNAFQVPVGTSSERPANPQPGFVRFNTTTDQFECFSGTQWVSAVAQISSQVLEGNNNDTDFILNQSSETSNALVMINGVIQIAYDAYHINGEVISFTEPPKSGDRIEVRYLSSSASAVKDLPDNLIISGVEKTIGPTPVLIDVFSKLAYRSAKYIVSAITSDNNSFACELMVVQNTSTAAITRYGDVSTGGPAVFEFYADLSQGYIEVSAVCSANTTRVRVQKFYTEY